MSESFNPFARGEMPIAKGFSTKRAANQFAAGDDECILSPERIIAINYDNYAIGEFGRAWGQVHIYEEANLQTDGYLSYDGILALRDLGSRIYEVRYGEQETEWDAHYYGKYECYGKRVKDGRVILAKWGDCATRQLILTLEEYTHLCEKIAQMPAHCGDFDHYKTRVRARLRGEHRYLIPDDDKTYVRDLYDEYGRRVLGSLGGWRNAILPYDHGYSKVNTEYFLLGTPDVWTAQCSQSSMRSVLYPLRNYDWGSNGKPIWLDMDIIFTRYQEGVFVQRTRLYAHQLMAVAPLIASESTGAMLVQPPNTRYAQAAYIFWNEEGVSVSLRPDRFDIDEHTSTFWFRRDVWDWVAQQTPEIDYWFAAINDELKEIPREQ